MTHQTATHEALIDQLNNLIHLDNDAIEAYEAAIERLSSQALIQGFSRYLEDHRRHIVHLTEAVRKLGGVAAEGTDVKALLTEGKVVLLGLTGDAGILRAMKSNEQTTNAKYEEALERSDLTPAVRDLLAKHLSDERTHRDWIDAQLKSL